MKHLFALVPLTLAACAPAYAVPVQRMADAQAAYRSAQDTGAAEDPQANLHLKLAEEQFAEAQTLLAQDENRRADFLLIRSNADAELALAMAQELKARTAVEEVTARAQAQAKQRAAAPVTGEIHQ